MRLTQIQLQDLLDNRALLDLLPLAFFIKDKEGRYILANQKYISAINFEKEVQILGLTDFDFISEEDAEYFYEADSLVLAGANYEVRTPIHEIENNHYHVATTKFPVYKGEEIVGVAGTFHDIAPQELQILDEYKTGEAIVREKILNGVNSAVFIIDVESNFLIRANTIGNKLLSRCNPYDKDKLLFDNTWGIETSQNYNELKTISINNSKYLETLKGYFTLTYGEIDWEDRRACIRYVNDVTQLIEGERDAQLMLSQLNVALAHSNLIYFDYNINSHIVTTTDYAQSALQVSEKIEDFPDCPQIRRIIHPDNFDIYCTSFESVKNGLKDYINFETLTLFHNKEYRWRDIKMSAIYDNEGRRNKIIITGSDLDRYKQLENRIQTVLENNDLGSWEFDIDSGDILLNGSYGDNIKKGNIMALKDTFATVYADDLANYKGMFDDIRNGIERSSCEYRAMWDSQTYDWYHSELSVLKDDKEKALLAIGSSRNITKLKLEEKRYNDEMTFLRLRNESQLIYCLINLSKNKVITFSSTNKKLRDSFTNDLTEVFYSKLSEEDKEIFSEKNFIEEMFNNFKKGITSTTKTVRIVLIEKLIYLKLTFKIIQNPETLELMCFIYGEDVDKEVKTQQMLQLSSDQNYELFTRIDFKNDEIIAHANENSPFGFNVNEPPLTVKEGLDRVIKVLNVTQERMDNLEDHFNGLLKENNPAYTLFTIKDENGIEYIKRSKLIYIDKEHRVFGEFWDDITELQRQNEYRNKQLADALIVAQSANDAKTSFLSSMSHDIRTPLNAIIGMNNLALEDIDNKEQVKESLEIIKESSTHLLLLINDILDLSRIESDKIVYNVLPYNANEILNDLIRRMKGILVKKKQKLIVDLRIKNPNIMLDKVVASRMIENILNNSSKFSGVESNIYLSIYDVISDNSHYNNWFLTIRDEGIGMSEEDLKNVFNPFFRSNSQTVNNIEGTGLGLAIVKKNLAEISGTIRMESKLGFGTTTFIEVPIRVQIGSNKKEIGAIKKNPELTDSQILENKKILVVEDNKINMLLATKILEKFKIKVVQAYDGKEAIEIFKSSPDWTFNCILSDIKMPVMDGLEMTRKIREMERLEAQKIPIIAMTANAFVSDVRDCLSSGMTAHISKPIDVGTLKSLLIKYLY